MIFRHMNADEITRWHDTELRTTFAVSEQKPLDDIMKMIGEGSYELFGLFDGADVAGYAAIWKAPGISPVLLDYLGVNAQRRSCGLGADILTRVCALGVPIIAEAELPLPDISAEENSLRERRIEFYERCGFRKAYTMATCGLLFQTLLFGDVIRQDAMHAHRTIYGPRRTDVLIPAGIGDAIEKPYWVK